MSRDNFNLPNLSRTLDQVQHDIYEGRGFAVIRGLDPKKYSVEDLTMIYLGLQSYVGDELGRQDKKGNMLGEHLHSRRKLSALTDDSAYRGRRLHQDEE